MCMYTAPTAAMTFVPVKKRAHIHQKPNGNSELNKISHKKMDNEIKKNENKERSFKNKCDGWSGGREEVKNDDDNVSCGE